MASFPIMHPHRILSFFFDNVKLEVSDSEVQEFWNHSRSMNEAWALASEASPHHIPLGVHGDSARMWTQYRVEKVVCVWLNILHFRPSSSRHSRFLIFSCPSSVLYKNRTLNRVWRRIVWSMNAAFEGVNPLLGEGGRPLTGADLVRAGTPLTASNRKFCLCEMRGDWEWHVQVWRFRASWQAKNTCHLCPAQSGGQESQYHYHYLYNEPDCKWSAEEFSFNEFVSKRLKDRQLCDLTVNNASFLEVWGTLTFIY